MLYEVITAADPKEVKAYAAPRYVPVYQVDTEPTVASEVKKADLKGLPAVITSYSIHYTKLYDIGHVRAGSGFPIRHEQKVVFVYYANAAYDTEDDDNTEEDFDQDRRFTPIAVSGDFNGWAEADLV